ncbi:MAG TPA: hypothetical protein VNT26_06295, partial [Candidatus Sulfotelmatobacter sp.]|nr:hypothetical protein [Candidatus Sulfotelmatobacter sp.]
VPDLSVRQFLLKNVTRHLDGTFGWKLGLQEIHKNYPALSEALVSEAPVDVPALFLRGENSDYLREEDMSLIRRRFPRAELRIIPRAGHLVHAENPAAFLEAVQEFLLSTTSETPGL